MENATIEKLSDAVNQLMNAYEKLQAQHEAVKSENNSLRNTIVNLENEKNKLHSSIDDLSNNKEQQSTQMNSMLSKIESMLTIDSIKVATPSLDFNTEKPKQEKVAEIDNKIQDEKEIVENNTDNKKESLIQDNSVADLTLPPKTETPSSSTKIDLGRMESLLRGM